jgi:casein kinase II subunit alpha
MIPNNSKKPFDSLINDENHHYVTKEGLDLLKKMLVFDHADRVTVKEALEHPFFYSIKDRK